MSIAYKAQSIKNYFEISFEFPGKIVNQDKNILVRIPYNPSKFTTEYPSNNSEFEILDLGDIISPGSPGLRKFKIKSSFPMDMTPYVTDPDRFVNSKDMVMYLRAAQVTKTPFKLLIYKMRMTGEVYDADACYCVIDKFVVEDQAGEIGEYYYDLTLIEYKYHDARIIGYSEGPRSYVDNVMTYTINNSPIYQYDPPESGYLYKDGLVNVNGNIYESNQGKTIKYALENSVARIRMILKEYIDDVGNIYQAKAPYLLETAPLGVKLGWAAASSLSPVK